MILVEPTSFEGATELRMALALECVVDKDE
jgi:hypothetical protein